MSYFPSIQTVRCIKNMPIADRDVVMNALAVRANNAVNDHFSEELSEGMADCATDLWTAVSGPNEAIPSIRERTL